MTREERVMHSARIPRDLKAAVDHHPDSNQKLTARSLRKEIGLNGKSELDLRIEQKQRRINLVKDEIEELEEELSSHIGDLEELEERREEIEETANAYENDLVAFLDDFAAGRAVFPRFKSEVESIGTEHNKSLKQVVSDIKDYADTHEYDIEDDRWTDSYGDGIL